MTNTKLSARNQFKGKILSVRKGGAVSNVEIKLSPSSTPTRITSVITNDAVEDLKLKRATISPP